MRIKVLNQIIGNILLVEELIRYKMALLQKPHENQTGNQTDCALVVILVIIRLVIKVIRKAYDFNYPSIPVTKFLIEFFCKNLNREAATQIFRANDTSFLIQILIRSVISDTFSQEITISTWIAVIPGYTR